MVSLSYCMAFLSFLYFLIFFPCLVFTGHSMRHIFFSFNEDLICFLPFKYKSVFLGFFCFFTFNFLSLISQYFYLQHEAAAVWDSANQGELFWLSI